MGFGRVGPAFWGFATQGVVPDVVTMGKPAGDGHPLAAVVTTPEIAGAFANGMEYFNTFGGNPVSAAVGAAVLDVIEREDLRDHATEMGARFRAGLVDIASRHRQIGNIRGEGLFLGVALTADRGTRSAGRTIAAAVLEGAVERGVLLSTDGPDHDVLKIKPPLVIGADDVDRALTVLDEVLGGIGRDGAG